ncbi:hypothetical protein DFH09DRAFT_1377811 [Mycena vulgaris]|nr:hypothetical protein DFH09DRAFT_1377811 [Mycena vulgaris]
MHLRDTRVFSELVENLLADGIPAIPHAEWKNIHSGLVYTQEDVDASRDFVMLTPCTTEADGAVSQGLPLKICHVRLGDAGTINTTASTAVYDVDRWEPPLPFSHSTDISRDGFPISEALALKPVKFTAPASEASKARAPSFESLPLDINIYQEISACLPPCGLVALTAIKKPPRALLGPRMDSFFFHYIVANEPHLFPAEEIECYGGNEEFDWWDES